MVRLVVPAYKFRGESALLECLYELEGRKDGSDDSYNYQGHFDNDDRETLYSVKWYKDNEEFYRFVPRASTPQHSYKVDGIRVDVSNLFFNILMKKYIHSGEQLDGVFSFYEKKLILEPN